MFGTLPLLRALLVAAIAIAAVLALGWLALRALRGVGIDARELKAYRARRREHEALLREVEAELAELQPTHERFEQTCESLQALQAAEPRPPSWAFWLQARR